MSIEMLGVVSDDEYLYTAVSPFGSPPVQPLSMGCFFNPHPNFNQVYPGHIMYLGGFVGGFSQYEYLKLTTDGSGNLNAYKGAGLLNSGGPASVFPTPMTLNTWYFLGANYNQTQVQCFQNGVAGPLVNTGDQYPRGADALVLGVGEGPVVPYGNPPGCWAAPFIFPFALTATEWLSLNNAFDLAAVAAAHGFGSIGASGAWFAPLNNKGTALVTPYGITPLLAGPSFAAFATSCVTGPIFNTVPPRRLVDLSGPKVP